MAHTFKGDFTKLESKIRKEMLPAKEILGRLNIKKDSTIIDFGCGIGYFSIPALDFVGESGKVMAIDISDDMLDELKKRAMGLGNLKIIKSDSIKGLRADIILLITLLHEIDNPKEFFKDCFSSLNPKGSVVVIDWQKKETPMGPPIDHRISKEDVIKMAHNSFIEHKIDNNFYYLEFKL